VPFIQMGEDNPSRIGNPLHVECLCASLRRAGDLTGVQASTANSTTNEIDRSCTVERLHAALNLLAFGVVLLDRHGHVALQNEATRRMCREKVGIRKSEHTIEIVWSPDREQFQRLVHRSCSPPPLRKVAPLLLRDARGKPVSVVFGHSLCATENTATAETEICAVLFIRSLNGEGRVTDEALRTLFRMTEAEACLVTVLYAGATLTEASRSLGKSMSTLRTQLRSAFGKTSTRRQVDLLRMIDRAVRL